MPPAFPCAWSRSRAKGLNETQLHDLAQFQIRNQIAVVKGAEIPAVFGGKYRQAMIYVDPYKLLSRQMSVMDVVDAVNTSNLILPAGDVKIGTSDYYVYSNSLVQNVADLDNLPIKTVGTSWVTVGDVGEAKDASQLQYNIVRIDGQKSAYIPIMKSGGDSNTIQVVNDVRGLGQASVRSSEATDDRYRLRSIGLRQTGTKHRPPRRRHRTGADQPHDSAIPREHAGHGCGFVVDSDFRAGDLRDSVHDG